MTTNIQYQYSTDRERNDFSQAVEAFLLLRNGMAFIPNSGLSGSFDLVQCNNTRPTSADHLLRAVGILRDLPRSISNDQRLCLKALPCENLGRARDAIFVALESVGIPVTNQDIVPEYGAQHWVDKLGDRSLVPEISGFQVKLPQGLTESELDQRLKAVTDYARGWSSYHHAVSQRRLNEVGEQVEAMFAPATA